MRTSESTAEIAPDLVLALAELQNPPKSEHVQAGAKSYSFTPLPELLDQIRRVLAVSNMVIVQEAASGDAAVAVTTRIVHKSGEWVEFGPLVLGAGDTAQTAGSAITYARRYALAAAVGIASDEDDDGQAASRPRSGGPVGTPPTSGSGGHPPSGSDDESSRRGGQDKVYGEGADSPAPAGTSSTHDREQLERVVKEAWGSQAKALRAARALWPVVTSLAKLTDEQLLELLGSAS